MTYEPDEQDSIIGAALASGGQTLVDQVHEQAAARAAWAIGWDRTGDEPPGYLAVWLIAARQVLDEHRGVAVADNPAGLDVPDTVPAGMTVATGYRLMAEGLTDAADGLDPDALREYVRGLARHLVALADTAEPRR